MSVRDRDARPSAGHAPRTDLRADCGSCFALCCVALPFSASADFATGKAADTPCRNLNADFTCGVHARLREEGFAGCTVFDCFGAGQRVSQGTFQGRDWRSSPGSAARMFAVFPVMRGLHELLWYLTRALEEPAARPLHGALAGALEEIEGLAGGAAAELLEVDLAARRGGVGALLAEVSALVRAPVRGRPPGHRGADLAGARLGGADLRGADLRGALLIAADLRDADLRVADLLGTDLRDADLRGADLTGGLFVTQPQLNAARGDHGTRLPRSLTRPAHW